MNRYPLVFTFRDLIAGEGFVAGVSLAGRSLLVEETAEEVWVYGVNPGGIAASSDEGSKGAMHEFRKNYRAILMDMAAGSASFADFEKEVARFLFESSDDQEWADAVEQVRKNGTTVAWARKGNAGAPVNLDVKDLTHAVSPNANPDPFEQEVELAACA